AGKRGMYVGDIIVTTEVPAERLTKAYHRQHQARVGASHARMKYLDRLDWDGRLIHQEPRRPMLLGTPGFIYRDLVGHAMGWLVGTIRARESRAFYHETRARYFCSYIVTRARDEG